MEIPVQLRAGRFGVLIYRNPEVLERLDELSAELQLLELIDTCVSFKGKAWSGPASELQGCLEIVAPSNQIRKLFYYSSACGVLLGKLADKMPHRVKSTKSKGRVYYSISPPEGHDAGRNGETK
jgi:hypothetical protein